MRLPDRFRCDHALLPGGWAQDVVLSVDAAGTLTEVARGTPGTGLPTLGAWVVPGMPNLHSHAFQRAMAGRAERAGPGDVDDFWSWREAMYAVAARIEPEALQAIAAEVYAGMLRAGYTAVCEFHYVHHRTDGSAYPDESAMAHALLAAAREAGIGITLLPVLYQVGGFDGRPLAPRQRRFARGTDDYLRHVAALRAVEHADARVGVAIHSLRAVPADALATVLAADPAPGAPIHVHVAEQLAEVDDCLRERGTRPVDWLLDHAEVDARWCVVHATHLSAAERARLAATGAVAGVCPTTEANLGDGLFALPEWLGLGGVVGIGSDSQVCLSPCEELRWLEYGQRLRLLRRNVGGVATRGSTGECLWRAACLGGAQASGRAIGAIAPGCRADLLVLDAEAACFAGRGPEHALDAMVFVGGEGALREVYVGGRRVVERGRHRHEERIAARWRAAMRGFS
jgi:formimidoylglutamate deiminase